MSTTRVFVILSLTTTPSRVFVSDTGPPLARGAAQRPLAQHGLRPGQVTARLADARRILRDAHGELEPEVEDLLAELPDLLLQLVVGHLAPLFGLHLTSPTVFCVGRMPTISISS